MMKVKVSIKIDTDACIQVSMWLTCFSPNSVLRGEVAQEFIVI